MREQEDGARKVEPCSPHKMSTTESSRYWDASRSDSRKDHSSRGSSHRDSSHRHSHGSGRSSADDPAFTPTRNKGIVPSNARTHPVADLRKDGSSRHGGLNHMHNHVSEDTSRDRKRRRSEDEEEVWTEHRSSSGRIYFYNKKLDKSQWERPSKGLVKKAKPESQSASKLSISASGGSSSSRSGSHSSSRTRAHSSSAGSGGKSMREHHVHSSSGSSHTPSRHSHSAPRERSAGSKPSSSLHHSGQRSGSHSAMSSPSTPVVPSKKPPPVAVVSPSSQPLPNTPLTPTPPFPPPFLNHTPRFPPPPFGGTPESPCVVSAPQLPPPQLPPQSSSAPFGPGVGQQNGPMVRPIPMPMSWAGSMVQPHPCPPPQAMESPGLHPLQKALFLQNQLAQPQAFVTSPAQLPLYALPQPPPQLTTPPPAMPPMMMPAKPVTPAELQHQQQLPPMALQQPQQVLIAQQQAQQPVYIKPAPPQLAVQSQQPQMMPAAAVAAPPLPSSQVLRVPMSRLGARPGNEVISPEFPDPASLKPPPPTPHTEFFSRVLSDTWWTTALDTCCKQMDRSHLECLSRNNVDSAYHCGQLARNLLTVECCRMIALSRTTRITHLRELMADIASNK